jgi:hypothetical protein
MGTLLPMRTFITSEITEWSGTVEGMSLEGYSRDQFERTAPAFVHRD